MEGRSETPATGHQPGVCSTPSMLLAKSVKSPRPARFGRDRSTRKPDEPGFFALWAPAWTRTRRSLAGSTVAKGRATPLHTDGPKAVNSRREASESVSVRTRTSARNQSKGKSRQTNALLFPFCLSLLSFGYRCHVRNFLRFFSEISMPSIGGMASFSSSMMYHFVPPIVLQSLKTSVHWTSPSPSRALGLVLEYSFR